MIQAGFGSLKIEIVFLPYTSRRSLLNVGHVHGNSDVEKCVMEGEIQSSSL